MTRAATNDGSERVQAAAASAQDRACNESAKEAQKEEPARASFVPPRNGRSDEAACRGNDGDREQKRNQMCRSERPHIATSGPSFVGRFPDPITGFGRAASSVIDCDQSEHEALAAQSLPVRECLG